MELHVVMLTSMYRSILLLFGLWSLVSIITTPNTKVERNVEVVPSADEASKCTSLLPGWRWPQTFDIFCPCPSASLLQYLSWSVPVHALLLCCKSVVPCCTVVSVHYIGILKASIRQSVTENLCNSMDFQNCCEALELFAAKRKKSVNLRIYYVALVGIESEAINVIFTMYCAQHNAVCKYVSQTL